MKNTIYALLHDLLVMDSSRGPEAVELLRLALSLGASFKFDCFAGETDLVLRTPVSLTARRLTSGFPLWSDLRPRSRRLPRLSLERPVFDRCVRRQI